MSARTTAKVAAKTGAAKDEVFRFTEDDVSVNLDVLANDPGAARIYSLFQPVDTLARKDAFPVVTTAFTEGGASISINADGSIAYDTASIQHMLQGLAAGEVFTDTFVYTIRMANGALSTASATIELVGVADLPPIWL
jgi:VCBS repeat-containing protein